MSIAFPAHPLPETSSQRDPARMFDQVLVRWQDQQSDLWIFGYASLIWRPEFEFTERRAARVHGWHRALEMWSRINRGTPDCPGLVFALLRGGSCQGVVFRIPAAQAEQALKDLWFREMPTGVYDPRWLRCATAQGDVHALAFTLSQSSPSYCGQLDMQQYRQIFAESCGRYGTTLDYAQRTYESLLAEGIDDHALARLLKLAGK
ncbi:gamma-glutamylcyclotransferase [Variovorax sp. PCZ-1]|uniref:gamma-glutamylcyclotransferase n=1 Tax=Variovorax sp. PCZ-1 TaxID=2835533 RepID=UPI001BD12517|nr:gamma-glutamylcyclotransferase [Variovorax sp. PCZ-1]MBS7808111.1 gamma-glutamylcyclotransferase [Variovorax sp. PCZ-1]